jgi:hypothetical protein
MDELLDVTAASPVEPGDLVASAEEVSRGRGRALDAVRLALHPGPFSQSRAPESRENAGGADSPLRLRVPPESIDRRVSKKRHARIESLRPEEL